MLSETEAEETTTDVFTFRNNRYQETLSGGLQSLLVDRDLIDVTFICDGGDGVQSAKAHKVVLGAVSTYFRTIFSENDCKHPTVVMPDVKISHLLAILDFIYVGEVNVRAQETMEFLDTAEMLKIKGLTVVPEETLQTVEEELIVGAEDVLETTEEVVTTEPVLEPGQIQISSENMVELQSGVRVSPDTEVSETREEGEVVDTDEDEQDVKPIISETGEVLAHGDHFMDQTDDSNIRRSHRMRKRSVRLPSPFMRLPGLPTDTPKPKKHISRNSILTPVVSLRVGDEDDDSGDESTPEHYNYTTSSGITPEGKPFKCPVCDKCYGYKNHVYRHYKAMHLNKAEPTDSPGFELLAPLKSNSKIFECAKCNKTFARNARLLQHMTTAHRKHQGPKFKDTSTLERHDCPICRKSFSHTRYLKLHFDAAHRGSSLSLKEKAEITDESIIKDEKLPGKGIVRRVPANERVLQCPKCTKMFNKERYLKAHYTITHLKAEPNPAKTCEPIVQCPDCSKSFKRVSYFKMHYSLMHCPDKSSAKDESDANGVEPKFKCPSCNKLFAQQSQVVTHFSEVHRAKRKVKDGDESNSDDIQVQLLYNTRCFKCNKDFARRSTLKFHIMTQHPKTTKKFKSSDGSEYKCQHCPKKYTDAKHLMRHFNTVHGKFARRIKCKQCGRVVLNLNSLRSHFLAAHPDTEFNPMEYML